MSMKIGAQKLPSDTNQRRKMKVSKVLKRYRNKLIRQGWYHKRFWRWI